jgi:hypothetical protein
MASKSCIKVDSEEEWNWLVLTDRLDNEDGERIRFKKLLVRDTIIYIYSKKIVEKEVKIVICI